VRAEYHSSYYGAFVIDPDGNKIEAVCHRPEKVLTGRRRSVATQRCVALGPATAPASWPDGQTGGILLVWRGQP